MPNDDRVAQGKNKKRKVVKYEGKGQDEEEDTKLKIEVEEVFVDEPDPVAVSSVSSTDCTPETRRRRKSGNGGERRALSIYRFLSYKFSNNYNMTVNKKSVTYKCKDKMVGQLMWEFATKGDGTGALGTPRSSAKAGGTVTPYDSPHKCIVDTRSTKDYPRQGIHSHLKQALRFEKVDVKQRWNLPLKDLKINVSHLALFMAGQVPPSEESEASHLCYDNLTCVKASHLVWEDSETNQSRKNCGQVVTCSCGQVINVCAKNGLHTPPCLGRTLSQPPQPTSSTLTTNVKKHCK